MQTSMLKNLKYILLIIVLFSISFDANADSTNVSFAKQNFKHKYISFSFGMGANYGNNTSLKNFIEKELPTYSTLTENDKLSDFFTGLDFFAGAEKQISKNFSVKVEYSYFLKSYNVKAIPNYDFTYTNHNPILSLFYVFPQDYSFIKFDIGSGYVLSKLNVQENGIEKSYTSTGFSLKTELILNAQISKNFAGYISGTIAKTILSDLKDSNENLLKTNGTKETINLSSLGFGIRLGVEIFIF